MATKDLTVGGNGALQTGDSNKGYTLVTGSIDLTAEGVLAADDVSLINVPAGTLVTHVVATVETVEGGALTADVGDSADDNGWIEALDLNVAGATTGAGAYAGGKLYTAADVIALDNLSGLPAAAVVKFTAQMHDAS